MGGQAVQRFCHSLVGQLHGVLHRLSLDHLGGHGGGRDGAAAAEGLKFHIINDIVLDLQINLHDIAAFGVANFADTVGILNHAHIPGMGKVIHNFFTVQCHIENAPSIDYFNFCVESRDSRSAFIPTPLG